jgi:hypothetical protein
MVRESDWVCGDVPVVTALIVICVEASAAVDDALTVNATDTGFAAIGLAEAGWNWHVIPAGNDPHDKATAPVNAPAAEIISEIGTLLAPGATVTAAGTGALRLKSTTCKTTGAAWVMALGSFPFACSPKK